MLAGLFIVLRRIERWMHQHVFKVGWLITQNYQTTTILYYTFFLPGVVLHEVVYWLMAGVVNVRAERAIQWPKAQEVGELKLNFVQLSNRAGTYRKAIISITPLVAGIVVVWYIASNIFDLNAVFATMSSGHLEDVAAGFRQLTAAPNFWLWIYIVFTVGNTMFPQVPKDLRGWRVILLGLVVVAIVLSVLGLGGEIFSAIEAPLTNLISVLQTSLLMLIVIDIFMVLVLGTIEYAIERTTNRSATFRGGKMITMTREEAIEERNKQRERERKRAEQRRAAAASSLTSVYELTFPLPGDPKDEGVTELEEQAPAPPRPTTLPGAEEEFFPAEKRPTDELQARIRMPQPEAESDEVEELEDTQEGDDERSMDDLAGRIHIPERQTLASAAQEPSEDEAQDDSETEDEHDEPVDQRPKPRVSPFTRPEEQTPPRQQPPAAPAKPASDERPKPRKPITLSPTGDRSTQERPAADKPDNETPAQPRHPARKPLSLSPDTPDSDEPAAAPSRFDIRSFSAATDDEDSEAAPNERPATPKGIARRGSSRPGTSIRKPLNITPSVPSGRQADDQPDAADDEYEYDDIADYVYEDDEDYLDYDEDD